MIDHIRKKMGKKVKVVPLPRDGCFIASEKRIELKKRELGPNIIVEHGKSPNVLNISERGKDEPFAVMIREKAYDTIILYECKINAKVIREFIEMIE